MKLNLGYVSYPEGAFFSEGFCDTKNMICIVQKWQSISAKNLYQEVLVSLLKTSYSFSITPIASRLDVAIV